MDTDDFLGLWVHKPKWGGAQRKIWGGECSGMRKIIDRRNLGFFLLILPTINEAGCPLPRLKDFQNKH